MGQEWEGQNQVNVGIGTTTPDGILNLRTPDNTELAFVGIKDGQVHFRIGFKSGADQNFYVGTGATLGGSGVYMTNGGTSWTSNSDERMKTNIQALTAAQGLAAIEQLNPVTFNWRDPSAQTTTQVGLIAQDVQKVFPEIVSRGATSAYTPDGALGISYTGLIPPLVKAVQELDSRTKGIETSEQGNVIISGSVGIVAAAPNQLLHVSGGNVNVSSGNVFVTGAIVANGSTLAVPSVYSRVRKTGSQSLTNSVYTAITWDSEDSDTNSMHDNSVNPSRITITSGAGAGFYHCRTGVRFNGNTTDGVAGFFAVNGMNAVGTHSGNVNEFYSFHEIMELEVNDYIEAKIYQLNSLSVVSGRGTYFWCEKLVTQ